MPEMIMKLKISHLLFALLLCPVIHETTFCAARAKYAGEFIAIGVGGRALGLGGAYTAIANDVTAGYWNPAGLSKLMYPQLTLMHDERFGGLINYDYGAVAIPVGANASLAFSAIRLGIDNIANTDGAWIDANNDGIIQNNEINYNAITYYNTADWALYLSYAKKANDRFSYGANLKFIRRDLGVTSATGVGFDVSAQYLIADKLALGANLQDITTTLVAWNNGTNELISPTLKLGSAYYIDAFDGRFTPAFDVDFRFEGRTSASNAHIGKVSMDFHTGLEFDFKQLLALRAGINELGSLNIGTGIHLPKFDIDYSFSKFDGAEHLGNTHRISLTFTLQAEQFARITE
jgi:hypothetical protein